MQVLAPQGQALEAWGEGALLTESNDRKPRITERGDLVLHSKCSIPVALDCADTGSAAHVLGLR